MDKQLQLQADQTVQVDEETDQRLQHSLSDFVEAIQLRQAASNGKAYAEANR